MEANQVPDPLTDGDPEHFRQMQPVAMEYVAHIRRGLFLLRALLELAPRPSEDTFVNDLAAVACFARVYRQTRAATLLVAFGYYSEVPTVLRAAYEAGALGRHLAKEPIAAERWLKKATWIPDRDVRRWFGDEDKHYAAWYGFMSARAHPSAKGCVPLLDLADDASSYSISFTTKADPEEVVDRCLEIAWVAMWSCFALRNAISVEEVIPPEWRKELKAFADDLGRVMEERTGEAVSFDHLERDWAKEDERWNAFIKRLAPAEEVGRLLDEHPRSIRNIRP